MIEHRPNRPSPWRARVRTPDGRWVSKSFVRKVDAEAWERSQRTDMGRGEWVDPRAASITLSRWLREVEASKLDVSDVTLATRDSLIRNHVDREIGHYPIGRISPEVLQRWVRDRSDVLAPASVHKLYTIVSEALGLAVARGKLVRNPNIEVSLPASQTPDHRYLTEQEVWHLADAMSPRYRIFVTLGAFAGLRPGEAFRAQWSDLNGQALAVRGTKTAASRRTVRVPPVLADELARHRADFPHISLILHNRNGQPVRGDTFRNRHWDRAVEASVGAPMRPYDLRHTHVALLIQQGAHSKVIADRLGHTSIRTTMDTYGHLIEGVEADVVDKLGKEQQWKSS
jgi:integrase